MSSRINETSENTSAKLLETSHIGHSLEDNDFDLSLFSQAAEMMWKFIPPVILVLGTFGNVMTIVMMRRMSEGQSSHTMSLYFTALAVSDLVILYTGLFQIWVDCYFGFNVLTHHILFCKLVPFFVYSSCMTSPWLVVAMTMQRVMSVVWPHYKSLSCTKTKVGLVIATTVLVPIALNAHRIISLELIIRSNSTDKVCTIPNKQLTYFVVFVYPWIDLVLSSITPFCILFVGNSVLVWKVIQSVHVARVMTAGGCDQVNSRQKKASSLTLTLITVSMVFLLLTLPICTSIFIDAGVDVHASSKMLFIWTVFNLSWYLNSAINFYLYCLSGARFKSEVKKIFCREESSCKLSTTTGPMTINIRNDF